MRFPAEERDTQPLMKPWEQLCPPTKEGADAGVCFRDREQHLPNYIYSQMLLYLLLKYFMQSQETYALQFPLHYF